MNKSVKIMLFCFLFTKLGLAKENPNFELFNKSGESIYLGLEQRDIASKFKSLAGKEVILVQNKHQYKETIPTDHSLYVVIYNTNKNKIAEYRIDKQYLPEKTVYVSFGHRRGKGELTLYPQTGPFLGLFGTTESGLSLKNNIKSSYIITIKSTGIHKEQKSRSRRD